MTAVRDGGAVTVISHGQGGTGMVKFIGIEESEARRRLLAVGTEIVEIGSEGSDLETETVARLLPEGERHVRGVFDPDPPEAGQEYAAHCAWHINSVNEAHTITSGRGIMQFWTEGGPVSLVVEAGDLLVNRSAEHRFLPLTHQLLRLRHSGSVDADFGEIGTGRAPEPWPKV